MPLTASSSTSAGSHSPCSPLLPSAAAAAVASSSLAAATNALQPSLANSLPVSSLGNLSRGITKEEDLSGTASGSGGHSSRSDAETKLSSWQSPAETDVTDTKWNIASTATASHSKSRTVADVHLKGAIGGSGSHQHNDSSCSSDPDSHHGGEHSNDETRAHYLSATCVVFTSYSGDVASVVDEHFTRALNFSEKDNKGKPELFFFIFKSRQTI